MPSWVVDIGPFAFSNAAYLIGLLAALIPLIIHLSRSRRTKKMRFSTTRFFTDQFLHSYRMSRLKELLLLATRMALFALLAMALAQPLFKSKGAVPARGAGPRAVALVIDNSASMGYTEDGTTLLQKARDAAATLLGTLKSGDTVSVVLAGRRAEGPEVLFPRPTGDLNDVRQAVDRLQVESLGTDLTGALAQAEQLVQGSRVASKEVYVFSDLQDSGWELPDKETKKADSSDVSYFFVKVRPSKAVSNRALTAVQYGSARPMVGVPFAIRPLVAVTGEEGGDVNVRLYVDGEKVGEQRAERLPNGRWATPRFHHTFPRGGWHSGYVEVDDKTLALDNRRYFALEVLESVKVLAVDGAPSDVPRLDELFFLRLALTASPEGQKSPIEVDTVSPAALGGTDLGPYPLVVLANVESLSAGAVEKLEDFVAGGGSVLFFLGDKVSKPFYNDTLAGGNRRFGGLLPCTLREVEGDPADRKDIASISAVRYEHPALSAFQDPKFGTLLGRSVTFKALWRVQAPADAVLMKASTGAPLLCEKAFGKGRVMLFTSTCDRDWTNFPIRPGFLPWTHRLVAYLAQRPAAHQAFHHTGEVVRLPAGSESSGPLLVKKPNGAITNAVLSVEETPVPVFHDTAQPGIYTLLTADQKEPAGMFAVNLEGYESELTYLDDVLAEQAGPGSGGRTAAVEKGLKDLLPGRPAVTFVEDPGQLGEGGGLGRHEWRLWDYFLVVVLFIGLFEPWLANRISARLYAKPREAPTLASPGEGRAAMAFARGAAETEKREVPTR